MSLLATAHRHDQPWSLGGAGGAIAQGGKPTGMVAEGCLVWMLESHQVRHYIARSGTLLDHATPSASPRKALVPLRQSRQLSLLQFALALRHHARLLRPLASGLTLAGAAAIGAGELVLVTTERAAYLAGQRASLQSLRVKEQLLEQLASKGLSRPLLTMCGRHAITGGHAQTLLHRAAQKLKPALAM